MAILAVGLLFVAESLTLRGDAGKYPLVVGLITAGLCVIDIAGRYLGRHKGGDRAARPAARLGQNLLVGGWIAATLVSFYLLGIIGTIALSGTVYFRLFVTPNLLHAGLIGLAHALAFWVAFDLLAGFNLYSGLFF